ncbi:MAG: glycogen synthase [Aurantibacter sp.]
MPAIEVIHITAECYPIAKVGGLADAVGAMALHQNELGIEGKVIMPFYDTPFVKQEKFKSISEQQVILGGRPYECKVLVPRNKIVWFDLFLVHIEGLLDHEKIYLDQLDHQRFIAFQIVVLDFLLQLPKKPTVIHCHDHHAGLVPFMLLHCQKYSDLRNIPTVLTIHNAHYQGVFGQEKLGLLPLFNHIHLGLLEWNAKINPLAAAIKCAWKVVTVSPTYLEELKSNNTELKKLMVNEGKKSSAILNGIDYSFWNPETDALLTKKYSYRSMEIGKKANKRVLCKRLGFDPDKPLFTFVGRLIWEEGADLLPEIFAKVLAASKNNSNFFVLGSGEVKTVNALKKLGKSYQGALSVHFGNDAQLKHLAFAGADFLLMPSRTEPCGSTQMIALRYGTIPVVNNVGGLNDTVIDLKKKKGFGIKHKGVSILRIRNAIFRAQQLYGDQERLKRMQIIAMLKDHSWRSSVQEYIKLYKALEVLR